MKNKDYVADLHDVNGDLVTVRSSEILRYIGTKEGKTILHLKDGSEVKLNMLLDYVYLLFKL